MKHKWLHAFFKFEGAPHLRRLKAVNTVLNNAYLAQILTNGLHNGALYALLAYGYVLTYSVTHRANIAHGAFFALAGQILVFTATLGYSALWLTLPAAIAFGMGWSILICTILLAILARFILPTFITEAPNAMIAATLGVSIVLMEAARLAADTKDYWLPPLTNQSIQLPLASGSPTLNLVQLTNITIIFFVLFIAQVILTRTAAGRSLRATSQDTTAAQLLGVNVKKVTYLAIISGGGLACLAGILAVLYFGNMSFGAGLIYGLKLLFITAAGGFSSPLRAAIAAFLFGEAESLWDGYPPIAWREPVFYSILALLLCLRRENQLERV